MKYLILFLTFLNLSCGVKGKPLPPLTPPALGRGEPNYSKATQGLEIDPKKKRKIQDDWPEEPDFKEEKGQ
jgi:hypothetical protein